MNKYRIKSHPILNVKEREKVTLYWKGEKIEGYKGEMLASTLFANGVRIFGHHHKDNSPQGIFCANGQCSQCMVIVNGLPVKSCMTPVKEGMRVEPLENYPKLPESNEIPEFGPPRIIKTGVLIIGLGGKLVLQTHKFFGSREIPRFQRKHAARRLRCGRIPDTR